MKRAVRSVLPLCVLFLLSSSSLWAQHPQVREGFWAGFGLGYGTLGLSCDGCDGDIRREGGTTLHFRLGGTLSKKLLLGFESDAFVTVGRETLDVMAATNMSAVLYFYPFPTNGFFVRGGLGPTWYHEDQFAVAASATGFGLVIGVGYDIRVARNLSITPVGTLRFGGGGDLDFGEFGTINGIQHSVASLELGLTYH